MVSRQLFIRCFLIAKLCLATMLGFAQQVKNVLEAFASLSSEPEIIFVDNNLKVPTEGGHLQGVQVIMQNGSEKLLISGSSLTDAYILQVDLATRKADKLASLMKEPFRHAGGIQVSEPYLAVGIEDNFTKTVSKACLYNYRDANLHKALPNVVIDRRGEPKRYTAGAAGLIAWNDDFLLLVGNWDSRHWDFYRVNPEKGDHHLLESFAAPSDWASYQSINLIMDDKSIYAIGFYKKGQAAYADLILLSRLGTFEPIMEKIQTKSFNCKKGVDFATAAGLQVDQEGNLHIWGTQRDARKKIAVNKFSQP